MAMKVESEDGILSAADARVFSILMAPNRTARRLMAADRTMAGALARVATLRRMKQADEARAYSSVERERARDAGEYCVAQGWGQMFHVQMPEAKPAPRKPAPVRKTLVATTSRRALRAYKAPLVDGRGRVALYMKITYVGFRSKNWSAGLPAAHIDYIYRDDALEAADLQLDAPISNMGESVEEISAGWRVLETIEEAYRANAKVQYRIVLNLPHELTPDERRALVAEFCERTFARLGLPYAAAIHEPDEKSDQRNYHAHICFSTRPCERTGDYRWAVSEEKVNGLTDREGLRLIRALAAAHMNRAAQAANLSVRFTHQTYAQRGLNAVRQEHVGPAAMAAHDRGETVNAVLRNAQIVEGNEAAEDCRRAEQGLELADQEEVLLHKAVLVAGRLRAIGSKMAQVDRIRALAAHVLRASQPGIQHDRSDTIAAIIALRRGAAHMSAALKTASARHRIDVASVISVRRGAAAMAARIAGLKPSRGIGMAVAAARAIATGAVAAREALRTARARPDVTLSASIASRVTALRVRRNAFRSPAILATADRVPVRTPALALARLSGQRGQASRLRADADIWAQRVAAHQQAAHEETRVAARALIMAAEKPPYRMEGAALQLDLSAFAAQEVTLFRSLDADGRTAILQERYARDQEEEKARRAREAARTREEEAAQARRALVAEACRLVMQARKRPYRIVDRTIVMDWSDLDVSGRATLEAVGGQDPDLRQALRARMQRDHAEDVAARDRAAVPPGGAATTQASPPVAPPVPVPSAAPVEAATVDDQKRTDTAATHPPGAQVPAPDADSVALPASPRRRWHPGMGDGGFGR